MAASEGHVPSSLSVLDIIYVLYSYVLGSNDVFLLSKGHASLAWYVVLAHHKIIPEEWLDHFCKPNAALQGHPENSIPGVAFSTGSLGHGLPGAVGMAYAKKVKGEPGHVWCLVGDGELMEGSCWESFRLIDDLGLKNISIIVDMNEDDRKKNAYRVASFFEGSVWISAGHDHDQLKQAFSCPMRLFLLHTIKGRGIDVMERDPKAWHHKSTGLQEILDSM